MTTIGILGGGQLGRMLAIEARLRGLLTVVRTDEAPAGPAGQVADHEICAPYGDDEANRRFVAEVDVVTSEFENLPAALLTRLAEDVAVHPSASALYVCQHREREKAFLVAHGIPHAMTRVASSADEVADAVSELGRSVMKSAAFGYDGRGQAVVDSVASARAAWDELGTDRVVVEQWVPFASELSVVGARGVDGSWTSFAPTQNVHASGILDLSVFPAPVGVASPGVALEAGRLSRSIAGALGYVGTIAVEFFVLDDGHLLVNEIAPRPHNSGHHTIESCATSQFGLQIDAVLGAPLGATTAVVGGAAMVNLLGDLWAEGTPDWSVVDGLDGVHLHLYGKSAARPGRKMGHLTVLAESPAVAAERALALRAQLRR